MVKTGKKVGKCKQLGKSWKNGENGENEEIRKNWGNSGGKG